MHDAILFSFWLPGPSSHDSSAWPCYAEGKLSAFSLSLASLRQQYVPFPRLPAYLSWQCLRLAHCNGTQTTLQHLLYNLALCPAHQYHRWRRFTLLHAEKLPRCAATHGLRELAIGLRQPYNLALSGHCGVHIGPHGLASDNGGQHQPCTDQAAYSLIVSSQG